MENRSALILDTCLTFADGHAEPIAALAMIEPRADRTRAISLGADEAYDAEESVSEVSVKPGEDQLPAAGGMRLKKLVSRNLRTTLPVLYDPKTRGVWCPERALLGAQSFNPKS